jgi:hypothetical protein
MVVRPRVAVRFETIRFPGENRMKKLAAVSAALVAAVCLVAGAAELESGLKPGESVGAYNVKDITGPNAGKSLCYRCNYGARPTVNVFARNVDDNLGKLAAEIDKLVEKNQDKKMAAFVTVLAEDADKVAPMLKELADKHKIKNVPLTIYDGESGPPEYKIAKDAGVTVMLWNKGQVKATVATEKGVDEGTIKKVVASADKILE